MVTATSPPNPAQRATLERIQHRLDSLPLLPYALMRLLRLDRSAADHFEQVRELVRTDPGLAVRLLRFANSSAVASPQKVTSIEHAMTLVGTSGVLRLALSFTAIRVFVPVLDWQKNLWRHAFDVAHLMEALAPLMREIQADPAHGYLLGLLHDIGRFVMYLEAPAEIIAVEETHWGTPQQLVEAERRLCGFTHAEVGYLALQKWGLSELLANQVRQHHGPDPAAEPLAAFDSALIGLLQDADVLSVTLGLGSHHCEQDSDAVLDQALQHAGLRCPLRATPAELRCRVRDALKHSAQVQAAMEIGG